MNYSSAAVQRRNVTPIQVGLHAVFIYIAVTAEKVTSYNDLALQK